jgi:hypothetical protein
MAKLSRRTQSGRQIAAKQAVSFASEDNLRGLVFTAGFADMERFFIAYSYSGWIARPFAHRYVGRKRRSIHCDDRQRRSSWREHSRVHPPAAVAGG